MISLPIGCTYRPCVPGTKAPHPERVVGLYVSSGSSLVVDQVFREDDVDPIPTVTFTVSGGQTVQGAFKNVQVSSIGTFMWIERQI